jgi:hypothetical protein
MAPDLELTIHLHHRPPQRIPWPKQINARAQIQRAFDTWYRANANRLLVQLEFTRRTEACLSFAFQGIDRALHATLTDELNVHVTWDDRWWDMLISLETCPQRVPAGYVCADCDPATRPTFSTREALWKAELFEPFLRWVNNNLAPAKALHLLQFGEMTTAKLILSE